MEIPLRDAVCTAQKGWEGQPGSGQRGQAKTRQCGGKHTKEEKSHIPMLKLVSRNAAPATALPPDPYREKEVQAFMDTFGSDDP